MKTLCKKDNLLLNPKLRPEKLMFVNKDGNL